MTFTFPQTHLAFVPIEVDSFHPLKLARGSIFGPSSQTFASHTLVDQSPCPSDQKKTKLTYGIFIQPYHKQLPHVITDVLYEIHITDLIQYQIFSFLRKWCLQYRQALVLFSKIL